MSWAPAFAALFFAFFSGFVIHHIARNQYNLKRRRSHELPPLYSNLGTRWLYFSLAAILLLIALYYAKPWWICSIVIVWNVIAWQSGMAMEYQERLQSMTRNIMESENLSRDDATKKAAEVIAMTDKYPKVY